ncbi:DinB family protein [Propylenella binzhouense]|uniref:Damage-inducible protein DinB n=1 Tax=Propylenella binzhouense TaxID=2555902 RepID=A0A964WSP4_9HYPH|nr:DinB family protein [Propylenella binzhouense]MYZ47182.1 damage-inducible protein DinB [Propylenella binzhouense]
MKAHYEMFAAYNRWANRRLYGSVQGLAADALRADRGLFFGSVLGTLNHLLVTDRIWMSRFLGEPSAYDRLDLVLFEALEPLREARENEDDRIVSYVAGLTPERLSGTFSYVRVSAPEPITQPLAPALAHFFNHQTHHRGQVHAALTGLGGRQAGPELDLVFFQRETGIGLAG